MSEPTARSDADRPMADQDDEAGWIHGGFFQTASRPADRVAVPLAEAAEIASTTTDALRHRYRRGTLAGYRIGRRLFLYRDSLPGADRPRERPADRTASDRDRPEIDLLRAQLAVKDQQLAAKDAQIGQLHVLLGRLQERFALPAPEASSPPRSWWRRWLR